MVMNPKSTPTFKDVNDLAAHGISQGVAAGIERFIVKRKLDVSPGPGSPSPVAAFTVAFTGELGDKPEIYPFTKSFKAQLDAVKAELMPHLKEIWDAGEFDNALALTRTVFFGETIMFLDENLKEVVGAFNAIRNTKIEMN